jgi:hypothetical protein
VTTENFMEIWCDTELRQYLVDISRSLSKNREMQKDLLQEAWLRISLCDDQKTIRFYKGEGFKAMDACYRKECRYHRLERWGKQYKRVDNKRRYVIKKHT